MFYCSIVGKSGLNCHLVTEPVISDNELIREEELSLRKVKCVRKAKAKLHSFGDDQGRGSTALFLL